MDVLAVDDFNRSDNADLGTNWTPNQSTFKILTNEAAASAAADACERYNAVDWSINQGSEVTLRNVDAQGIGLGAGVSVRCATGATTFYRLAGNGSGFELGSFVAATFASIASGAGTTFASGDKIRLEVVGQGIGITLTCYKNGTLFQTSSNPTNKINSGRPGVAFSSPSTATVDDWQGTGSPIAGWKSPTAGPSYAI